jgi:hypothetical protein
MIDLYYSTTPNDILFGQTASGAQSVDHATGR